MSSPALRPKVLLDVPSNAPGPRAAQDDAIALASFRDLQAAGMIPASARFTDAAPSGATYADTLRAAVGDANRNGKSDLDLEAIRSSGILGGDPGTNDLSRALSGPRAPINDQFLAAKDPSAVTLPYFMSCSGAPTVNARGLAMERASAKLSLASDLPGRAQESPEAARAVASEAIAGAQFYDNTGSPREARDLLVRSGEALLDAGRLEEARAVYGELNTPARGRAALEEAPSGSSAKTYGELAEQRLGEIDHRLGHLDPSELSAFSPEGRKFINGTCGWIDEQIAANQKTIADKQARGLDHTSYDYATARIADLEGKRAAFVKSIRAGAEHGDQLLTLGNVVQNEAGVCGDPAKTAVAYAWLNRTGGNVRGAKDGGELSHFVDLQPRWDREAVAGKMTLLDQLPASLRAADERLSAPRPSETDPTQGATHWVSPAHLPAYDARDPGHRADRYSRDYGDAKNRAFPDWARDPEADAATVASMKRDGSLLDNYQELTLPNVPGGEFLFYTGVKYTPDPPASAGPGL
ncbi:MAG: hypothetical protein U1E65_31915 [Myxococcota bacterium]